LFVIFISVFLKGIKYNPGEFPEEWLKWVDDNLLRGVEPGRIVSILASKGFHPHKNIRLMHRIIAWVSLIKFTERNPQIDVHDCDEPYDEPFLEWIRLTVQKGIDGTVLYELLQDRYIDITKHHLLFSQKLKNNEIGIVMGKDGTPANLLDLHHACACGYLEDVVLYCKCGSNVNEEAIDRHSCERIRPLSYAAMYGHADVCKILLSYGANVNAIDLRGRNATHLAAFHGHRSCLEVLIDAGGKLFVGDLQGNTSIHLAAISNRVDCVDYLASRGQDLTRILTSDKVKPKKDSTFDQLVEVVFNKVMEVKLKPNESIRFEKIWLHDAAVLLTKLMDDNVKYMLPKSCKEIMEDVLERFDPRPETGIFINSDLSLGQTFIKTIPAPNELSILLKYVYRQACIDSINSWRRTALHLACDANKVNSHEQIIFLLVDKYGCNVNLKDMHKRKGIDLLIQDKTIRDMPTATKAREDLIIIRRQKKLDEFYDFFKQEEKKKIDQRHQEMLQECINRQDMMEERAWNCLRTGAIFIKRYNLVWELYDDPDTGNYFYCKMPEKPPEDAIVYQKQTYSNYTWEIPREIKSIIDRTDAIDYLLKIQSVLLRKYENWEVYMERTTGIEFFYNIIDKRLRFSVPICMNWRKVVRESSKTDQILGYAREWEVRVDRYGNKFYRNKVNRQCDYHQPLDAIEVPPVEKLCTSFQVRFSMFLRLSFRFKI
jgi:ankyrin repeat protein